MVNQTGQNLLQLEEQAFAGLVAVGVHVECQRQRGRQFSQLFLILGREQRGRGDGDGLMTGGEHGPAVGAAFGNVELVAWAQQIQNGQIVDAALRPAGESEPRRAAAHQVAILNAHKSAVAIVVRYLQPRHISPVLP